MLVDRAYRWLKICLRLALLLTPLAHASVCSLHGGMLSLGAVAGNPFSADVLATSWQVPPNDTKKQVGILIVFHVARDKNGRVFIKGPTVYGDPGQPYIAGGPKSREVVGEPTSWHLTICDPVADTTTYFAEGRGLGSKQAYVAKGLNLVPGLLRSSGYWRNRKQRGGKWVDLGHEDFKGLNAQGYRWGLEKTPDGTFVEENFTEQWISEDLQSELLIVKNQTPLEERTELTHILRLDPGPTLFEIPEGYEVINKPANSPETVP
jgi:hypothetical protein